MSIFGAIRDAIFGSAASAAPATGESAMGNIELPKANVTLPTSAAAELQPGAQKMASAAGVAAGSTAAGAGGAKAAAVDVAAVLDDLDSDEDLDWRKSIVDLMKLLKLDSSLTARKALAKELAYTGDMGDSAKMNVWLHKQVMTKLAENGGVVPADLRD